MEYEQNQPRFRNSGDVVLFLRALPLAWRAQRVRGTPLPEVVAAMGEISLLFLVQSAFIIVAGVLATFTMWRVRHEVSPALDKARGWAWPFLALGCVAYLCLNIFIALQAG